VPVQHISFKFFASETDEALAMRAGEIDIAFPSDGQAFETTSGAKMIAWPQNQVGYFGMNTKLAPWSDLHVRLAVAYALNREDIIVANGGAGSAVPDYTFIPPRELTTIGSASAVNSLLVTIPQYQFNLAKAKQQMAESAYPHGFTATIDIIEYASFADICQVMAAELAKIGITLKLNVESLAEWTAEIYGPKTYGPMFTTIHESSPDPSGFPAYLLGSENVPSGGLNFANWDPPSVDNLLAAGVATTDPAKRLAIYGQVLKELAAAVPYVPLYQTDYYVALSSSAKVALAPFNVDTFEIPWALGIKPVA
jgi:peptide/nickel transport system substrate-binding protein